MSKKYLLDANAFIEAKNRYYGFDLCPGFWDALVAQHENKRIFSIDRIAEELREQKDELEKWVEDRVPESFFKKTEDHAVITKFQELTNWVFGQAQFLMAAKTEFASVADGWVVAYAAVNGLVVVTLEQLEPQVKRRVPIPNICEEFDVEYVDTFAMLRDLGETFVRGTKRHK